MLGAGGHCLSVLDSLLSSYDYQEIGIIDKDNLKQGITQILGVPILGSDEDMEQLYKEGYRTAFVTVGSVGDISIRERLFHRLKGLGYQLPNVIDRTSVVSNYASLGEGVYIGKRAVINAGTVIGNLAIINTASTVEHDCRVGDYVHIAPGSVVCGNVCIEQGAHVGAGSVIRQGIHIGEKAVVGCGSVVVRDVPSHRIAYGNPCRVKDENKR